jgi:hypothetical protein
MAVANQTETSVKPLEEAHANATPQVVQTKIFNWGSLHRGDCEQDGGKIMFHSDGTGTFTATTLTYHTSSGDIWHASFAAKGSNGATLFSTGTFNSPRMNDGNPPPKYSWSAQFSFLPEYFQGIASVSQNCSC